MNNLPNKLILLHETNVVYKVLKSLEHVQILNRGVAIAPPPPVADATVRGTGDQRPLGNFFFIFPHFNHGRRHSRQTAIPSLIFWIPDYPHQDCDSPL